MTEKLFDILWVVDQTLTIILKIVIIIGINIWLLIQWRRASALKEDNTYLTIDKDL